MNDITVAAVQIASEIGDVRANADKMGAWIDQAADAGARLVFFPECSLTGYTTDQVKEAAITWDDAAAVALERHAAQQEVAVGYGFAERDDASGLYFISYVVSSDDGRLLYRKAHLGSLERPAYAAGDELPVARIKGVNIGVQLCWEGHIPDIATTLRSKGAELVLTPHAGGLGGVRRLESWSRYLPARAVDNGMFVIACNALWFASLNDGRGGAPSPQGDKDPEATLKDGGMVAYGPNGKLLASYDRPDEHMMLVSVGGELPRESTSGGMMNISYFDRRRPELYR